MEESRGAAKNTRCRKIHPLPTQPQAQASCEPAQQHVPLKEPPQLRLHLTYEPRGMDRDDDTLTDITRTEDAAFRKALGVSTDARVDDEDDEIA